MLYFLMALLLAVSARAQLPEPLEVPIPDGMAMRSGITRLGPDTFSRRSEYPIALYGRAVSATVYSEFLPNKGGPAWTEFVGVRFEVKDSWSKAPSNHFDVAIQWHQDRGSFPIEIGKWYLVLDPGGETRPLKPYDTEYAEMNAQGAEFMARLGPPVASYGGPLVRKPPTDRAGGLPPRR